jgi:hypothetical protein
MAQYLIVHDDGVIEIEIVLAKNIQQAARDISDGETAMIYRLVGPGKQVTARVKQKRLIEISDPSEDT